MFLALDRSLTLVPIVRCALREQELQIYRGEPERIYRDIAFHEVELRSYGMKPKQMLTS